MMMMTKGITMMITASEGHGQIGEEIEDDDF